MQLEFVPLLEMQRELHRIPRGGARFEAYLRVMLQLDRAELRLPPLVMMNPMGKEHVTELLDALAAFDADGLAADEVRKASTSVADVPGSFKLGLVIADDAMGGWTNRYSSEFNLRFAGKAYLDRGWLAAVLWSSEPAAPSTVREAVLASIHRAAYILRHGTAQTLAQMLKQEGHVLAMAGCAQPALHPDDLDYTREVIAEHLEARGMPTAIECLFGDAAARSLGMTPRGLSPWAGLALALADARRHGVTA